MNDIVSQRKTIRQGVGELFRMLPASLKQEVIDYAISNARIRSGFADLLAYCKANDIEFYVTSGGIDFFVYPLLAPFNIPTEHYTATAVISRANPSKSPGLTPAKAIARTTAACVKRPSFAVFLPRTITDSDRRQRDGFRGREDRGRSYLPAPI